MPLQAFPISYSACFFSITTAFSVYSLQTIYRFFLFLHQTPLFSIEFPISTSPSGFHFTVNLSSLSCPTRHFHVSISRVWLNLFIFPLWNMHKTSRLTEGQPCMAFVLSASDLLASRSLSSILLNVYPHPKALIRWESISCQVLLGDCHWIRGGV